MNIIKFLKELPEWNELIKLPEKVKELEERLDKLENPVVSLDACPKCNKNTFEIVSSKPASGHMGKRGVITRAYTCTECGFSEPKTVRP